MLPRDPDGGSPRPRHTPPPQRVGARPRPSRSAKPNILVILVDQLRFPQWFSPDPSGMGLPPNLRGLRQDAVSFGSHYTASNDCSPARSTLLTGLYTHQTGCMITGGSTLDPGFPDVGDDAARAGLRHLLVRQVAPHPGDNHWTALTANRRSSATASTAAPSPRPTARPARAGGSIRTIADAVRGLVRGRGRAPSRGARPCRSSTRTTSPGGTGGATACPTEAAAPRVVDALPPNFETPEQLIARHKPRLQRSLQETRAASFGSVPVQRPGSAARRGSAFLDLYVKLQLEVDRHIGQVLRTLESRPEVAANTVIVFTSDHGEYGASHGLRGKGAGAYEEGIRVPLIVTDYAGSCERARNDAHAADLERRRRAAAADDRHRLRTTGAGTRATRRSPAAPTCRASSRNPDAPGRAVRAARDRRGRHRVRAAALRRRRAAAHRRAAHAAGQVRDLHELALRQGSRRSRKGRRSSSTTTRTQGGRLEIDNIAGRQPARGRPPQRARAGDHAGAARAAAGAPRQRARARHRRVLLDRQAAAVTAALRRKRRSEREAGGVVQEVPEQELPPSSAVRPRSLSEVHASTRPARRTQRCSGATLVLDRRRGASTAPDGVERLHGDVRVAGVAP